MRGASRSFHNGHEPLHPTDGRCWDCLGFGLYAWHLQHARRGTLTGILVMALVLIATTVSLIFQAFHHSQRGPLSAQSTPPASGGYSPLLKYFTPHVASIYAPLPAGPAPLARADWNRASYGLWSGPARPLDSLKHWDSTLPARACRSGPQVLSWGGLHPHYPSHP